jgi:RimJ/RimL family protein N-acetyltransferase
MVRIRPIRTTDAGLLTEAFERLSPESRRLRFLAPKHSLTSAEVRYFTDVDHHDHEALVAVHPLTGRGIGVARYVRHRDDPDAAEFAVTVVDEWQGRNLGAALVTRLMARATSEGVSRFTALISTDNMRMRRLLKKLPGTVRFVEREADALVYEIDLRPLVRKSRPAIPLPRTSPEAALAGC